RRPPAAAEGQHRAAGRPRAGGEGEEPEGEGEDSLLEGRDGRNRCTSAYPLPAERVPARVGDEILAPQGRPRRPTHRPTAPERRGVYFVRGRILDRNGQFPPIENNLTVIPFAEDACRERALVRPRIVSTLDAF